MTEEKGNIFEKDKDSEIVGEPEQFLESEEHTESHAEVEIKLHVGEKETDVYTEEGREELTVDEGEISSWEEGFSEGATGKGQAGTCAHCENVLGDREEGVVEREYQGKKMFFCSDKCAGARPSSQ